MNECRHSVPSEEAYGLSRCPGLLVQEAFCNLHNEAYALLQIE